MTMSQTTLTVYNTRTGVANDFWHGRKRGIHLQRKHWILYRLIKYKQKPKRKSKNMDTQNDELLKIAWYIMNIPYVVNWTDRWVLCIEPIQGPGTFFDLF